MLDRLMTHNDMMVIFITLLWLSNKVHTRIFFFIIFLYHLLHLIFGKGGYGFGSVGLSVFVSNIAQNVINGL